MVDHLGISNRHRHREQRQRIGVAMRVSEAHDRRAAAEPHRMRPVADEAYLRQLSERMADALGLPLATAKARVQAVAVSAGGPLDGGGDARWWKARQSRDRY